MIFIDETPSARAMSQVMAGGKEQLDQDAPFEEIIARLESVVKELESGELSLEDSLLAFETGVKLSRAGAARLDAAEARVEELLENHKLTGAKEPISE